MSKQFIQITVVETRQAIIVCELPEGKTIAEIKEQLYDAGINWEHFEKRSDTINLETTVIESTVIDADAIDRGYDYLHEIE